MLNLAQTRRPCVLFHHQPQSEGLPFRRRRSGVSSPSAAQGHARLQEIYHARGARSPREERQPRHVLAQGHELQPADENLFAEQRHRRQLSDGVHETCLENPECPCLHAPSCSISTVPLPIPLPISPPRSIACAPKAGSIPRLTICCAPLRRQVRAV